MKARDERYGGFENVSSVSQGLKDIVFLRTTHEWSHAQAEAMEMILHKVARLVCGGPDHVDSWVDIAGYANLGARSTKAGKPELKPGKPPKETDPMIDFMRQLIASGRVDVFKGCPD